MDTITQALLGGAVGYAVAGKHSRKKALLWGAGIAILPDLDVFIPYDNDLDAMTFHRSWSHSWLVQTALAPFIALLLHRIDKVFPLSIWWLLIWSALITHSALDALTVYGTQLFWPFMPPPVSGGSVFIIDPTYSVPLLAGFISILLWPNRRHSDRIMHYGFAFSCLYLIWGFGAQQWISHQAKESLARQQIEYDKIQVSATAFNTLLWRVLVVNEDVYYEGFRSLFDEDDENFHFQPYPRGSALMASSQDLPAFQRIDWFTNGLFKLEEQDGRIIATDLRMGIEPGYFFRFQLAENNEGDLEALTPNRVRLEFQRRQGIDWVWQRIWNPSVQFHFTPSLQSH
jgi:inner membrane protein